MMNKMNVYDYVPAAEALNDADGLIVDTTWVDDAQKQKSRLCAREFASDETRNDMFSPTPPLIATKVLVSECASHRGRARQPMQSNMNILEEGLCNTMERRWRRDGHVLPSPLHGLGSCTEGVGVEKKE